MTPLSAARSDALTRTVHHALRAQLLSSCCCLTLACVYSYWIHGSTLLGIDMRAMPLLSAYPSTVEIRPAVTLVCNAPFALVRSALFVAHAAIVVDKA
eukprot:2854499-Pleurochrysis_carterae.AAC.1